MRFVRAPIASPARLLFIALGLSTTLLAACDPETILGAMGADTRRIAVDLEVSFDSPPTPAEFAAMVQQFRPCPEVPAQIIPAQPTELRLVDVSETYRSGPVSAMIDLPRDMRVFPELSHSNAAWWKREPRETIVFWGSTGQGNWSITGEVIAASTCWDLLAVHVAYRKYYVAPHKSDAESPVHMAFGQVVFSQGVGVMWGAWAPSRERLDQLIPIIYSLRLR